MVPESSEPGVLRLLRLEAALRDGVTDGVPDVITGAGGDPELEPFVSALAVTYPAAFGIDAVKRASAMLTSVRSLNSRVIEVARPLFEAFEERETRWAVLGAGVHADEPSHLSLGVRLAPLRLLVHPYDAPRARVTAVTRGFRRIAESWLTARFERDDVVIVLETGLHPRGWPALPLSPILDTSGREEGSAIRLMSPDAAWVAERLLLARSLWHPSSVSPARIIELVILSRNAGPGERALWAASAKRWGIATLWKRCDELEAWLAGGVRPGWIDPSFGVSRSPSTAPRGWPPFALGLALQDSAARKIAYAVRRIIGKEG